MKSLLLYISIIFCCIGYSQEDNTEVTTYYLIRHAEKDTTDKTNKDPHLTEIGKERAKKWATYFEGINLGAIYSTDYQRTKQTAEPTAKAKDLDLIIYNPFKIDVNKLAEENEGKTILIVGHSNTTPMLTNKLLGEGKYEDMKEDDNGSLYKVTYNGDTITSEVLKIE